MRNAMNWGALMLALMPATFAGAQTSTSNTAEQATIDQALPYPDIADTSHAAPELLPILRKFYTAKSKHSVEGFLGAFAKDYVYADVTRSVAVDGGSFSKALQKTLPYPQGVIPGPDAASYPIKILGDKNSAIVFVRNGPEFRYRFGLELRPMISVTLDENGKFIRWVDYWDGRSARRSTSTASKFPSPQEFRDSVENASPDMRRVATALQAAYAAGDAAAAARLFSIDAIYEDWALQTIQIGQSQIQRYLTRALPKLPFGPGAKLAHVSGSSQGGGYEWYAAPYAEKVKRGITALELDKDFKITYLATTYDTNNFSYPEYKSLVSLAAEEQMTQAELEKTIDPAIVSIQKMMKVGELAPISTQASDTK